MTELIFTDPTALAICCRRNHIRRLSLFGSRLNGDAGPASDVDLLVEFEPGQEPGLMGLGKIEAELASLMSAPFRVDLRTPADLSRHFRDEILETALLQYAA